MNAMKDSPGCIGRMARVGEQMPMNKRDGYPSFEPDFEEAENYGTAASAGLDNPIHNQSSGGGGDGNG